MHSCFSRAPKRAEWRHLRTSSARAGECSQVALWHQHQTRHGLQLVQGWNPGPAHAPCSDPWRHHRNCRCDLRGLGSVCLCPQGTQRAHQKLHHHCGRWGQWHVWLLLPTNNSFAWYWLFHCDGFQESLIMWIVSYIPRFTGVRWRRWG